MRDFIVKLIVLIYKSLITKQIHLNMEDTINQSFNHLS